MLTEDLELQYHNSITADRRIEKLKKVNSLLDQMIKALNPITKPMQLIHITSEAQFNVAVRAQKALGKKPFEIQPRYYGPCYLQDTDNYLVLRQHQVTEDSEIIPFEDFINDHK